MKRQEMYAKLLALPSLTLRDRQWLQGHAFADTPIRWVIDNACAGGLAHALSDLGDPELLEWVQVVKTSTNDVTLRDAYAAIYDIRQKCTFHTLARMIREKA